MKRKMTRSIEVELKETFDGDDFEFRARRRCGLRKNKDNPFVTFSSDDKQVIKFPTYEDTRLHAIECKTKLSGTEQKLQLSQESIVDSHN